MRTSPLAPVAAALLLPAALSPAAPVPRDLVDPGLIWLTHSESGRLVACRPSGATVAEVDARDAYHDPRRGLVWRYEPKNGAVTATGLDGKKAATVASPGHFLGFSDDGTKVLFPGQDGKPWCPPAGDKPPHSFPGCTLHYQAADGKGRVVATGLPLGPFGRLHWLPDGDRVVTDEPMLTKSFVHHHLFDAGSGQTTDLGEPASAPRVDLRQVVCGATPDGRWLITRRVYSRGLELSKVPMRGGDPEPLAAVGLSWGTAALSPDGRRVACLGRAPRWWGGFGIGGPAVCVVDVGTGEVVEGDRSADAGWAAGPAWSPDGKSLAYLLGPGEALRVSLVVCDARGRDARTVLTLEDKARAGAWDGWRVAGWFPTPAKAGPIPKR